MNKTINSKIEFSHLPFSTIPVENRGIQLGLVTLETDLTIESELRFFLSAHTTSDKAGIKNLPLNLLHTRIPCSDNVTTENLSKMEDYFVSALSLFPNDHIFDVVGYGCTSAALVIGEQKVEQIIKSHVITTDVTTPLTAAKIGLKMLGAKKIGFLAPYISNISHHMCDYFFDNGFLVTAAATFGEGKDSVVGWISPDSIMAAIEHLVTTNLDLDAIFVSCTSLKCEPLIFSAEKRFKLPIISSNSAIAWHMAKLSKAKISLEKKGALFQL
jgi:maleate isomerase